MQFAKIIQKPITGTSNTLVLFHVKWNVWYTCLCLHVGEGAAGGVGMVGGKELFYIIIIVICITLSRIPVVSKF